MNNKNATKRKLTSSVLAMIVCIAMLIGTTFAWFTDTASTGVNNIQAGKLDVALEMKDNSGAWVTAEGKTLQFKVNGAIPAEGTEILWEPGCTYQLPELRVVNKGDLALKYKVIISGIQGDAKLNEAIEWTIGEVALGREQTLAAGANSEFTIKGHMKESAGNEYQGLSIDGIAITVVATQLAYEYDSSGYEYDADAAYPVTDSEEFNNALTAGGSIALASDVQSEAYLDWTKDTAISLGGNTLTIGDNTELTNGANLTVLGGTVSRDTYSGYVDVRPGTTTDSVITYTDVVFDNTYKTKTYGPCTDRVKSVVEYCPENGGNATFYFKNCTFNNAQVLFEGLSGTTGSFTATFENCTFNNLGTSAGIKVDNYLNGTITVKDCTFNLTATSGMNAISSRNSVVTWNFEGANTVNGSAATASGVDSSVDQIKVKNPSVNVYSINTTNGTVVNGLDTVTVTGIALN